ncbi:hypothetical protein ACVSQB_37740 [Bradyrhizobium elkanii]
MSHFFHDIATPRVTFNEGFKAFFGFAVLAIAAVGSIISFVSESPLPFWLGVLCGMLGGATGFVVANFLVGRSKG